MNNFISLFLATLTHAGVMTKDEAKKIDDKLQQSTLPDEFEASYQMVKKVFEEAEIDTKNFLKK